ATSFFKAFVWSHGANIPVPMASPNDTQSAAQAMNDAGHIVGWSGNLSHMNHRYLWAHGEITPLDSTVSWSLLNNRDQIARDEAHGSKRRDVGSWCPNGAQTAVRGCCVTGEGSQRQGHGGRKLLHPERGVARGRVGGRITSRPRDAAGRYF